MKSGAPKGGGPGPHQKWRPEPHPQTSVLIWRHDDDDNDEETVLCTVCLLQDEEDGSREFTEDFGIIALQVRSPIIKRVVVSLAPLRILP